jgi:hypothetical protein
MKLRFTTHLWVRLYERNISVEHIKHAILSPDIIKTAFDSKVLVRKNVGDKTIEVIYYNKIRLDKRAVECVVVTAYYL